jgi:hypothetical protein
MVRQPILTKSPPENNDTAPPESQEDKENMSESTRSVRSSRWTMQSSTPTTPEYQAHIDKCIYCGHVLPSHSSHCPMASVRLGDAIQDLTWGGDRGGDPPAEISRLSTTGEREVLDSKGLTRDVALDRLQNMIPGEVITLWATLQGLLVISGRPIPALLWILLFLVSLAFIPPYLDQTIDQSGVNTDWDRYNVQSQIILATGAFVVWVYYLGGPFEAAGYHDTLIATILVFLYPALVLIAGPYYTSRGIQKYNDYKSRGIQMYNDFRRR